MVEKWIKIKRGPLVRYGMPVHLFKDSDKDGVSNVFDCKPHNKRKQDAIAPQSYTPLADMWGRQERSRQDRLLQAELARLRRLEEQRLAELKAQQTPVSNVVYTRSGKASGSIVSGSPYKVTTSTGTYYTSFDEPTGPISPTTSLTTIAPQKVPPKGTSTSPNVMPGEVIIRFGPKKVKK